MKTTASTIDSFHDLNPKEFPVLLAFEVRQEIVSPRVTSLSVTLDLGKVSGASRLALSFHGVKDLKVNWPNWSVIRVDVIEITDIADRGFEELQYRIHEGTDFFSFSCREFVARIE